MAFHGARGTSRGRGFGSGNSRGRGGAAGAGARGRGRGGVRGGRRKPIFDSARVAQQRESDTNDESESESPPEEEDSVSEEESSEEEEKSLPTARSYAALMQQFAAESAPQSKRRKLDHEPEPQTAQKVDEADLDLVAEESGDADRVEEREEGPETIMDDPLTEEDENESTDTSDPFEVHFASPDDNILNQRLKSLESGVWTSQIMPLPKIGKAVISVPGKETVKATELAEISGPGELKLKKKLANVISKQSPTFNNLEKSIARFIFSYQDVLYCERTTLNSESLRRLVCLHAVNHVFKTRDRVIKNNARLAREEANDDLEFRDQGFTRPKVLMILPTRESCVKMVNMITSLCEPEQQENRKRFDEAYVEKEEKFSGDKAEDFRDLFSGNDDDMFRLGLKFTRKTVKYFSQFYNSDIIFASPLGLRMALEGRDDKAGDSDFLSSIEMVIVDQANALLMQNWEHVEYIFEHLNLQPKEAHGCDFSRVRSFYLDTKAKNFRQTIALSPFNTPELNTLFFHQSKNWAGKVKVNPIYNGAIQELGLKSKQTFSRLESPSLTTDHDARFAYFTAAIIPSLTRRAKDTAGTVIFIPSYYDFLRVQNYFATSAAASGLSFGSISEYNTVKEVARARSHFFTGRHSILLYTERAHHFRRYQLRGVKKVIMYGLPDNPIFYKEIVAGYFGRSVQEGKLESGQGSVRVMFSKWDRLKLERIAGTDRFVQMIRDKGDTFDFM